MKKIIEKWKLNKSLLANKLGMTNTTFNKKLKKENFSDKETIQLKLVLKEMYNDLESVIDVDFNDALSALVKK